jgi:hypothetical protein
MFSLLIRLEISEQIFPRIRHDSLDDKKRFKQKTKTKTCGVLRIDKPLFFAET